MNLNQQNEQVVNKTKKPFYKRWWFIVIIILLIIAILPTNNNDVVEAQEKEIETLENTITDKDERIHNLNKEIDSIKSELDMLKKEIEKEEKSREDYESELQSYKDALIILNSGGSIEIDSEGNILNVEEPKEPIEDTRNDQPFKIIGLSSPNPSSDTKTITNNKKTYNNNLIAAKVTRVVDGDTIDVKINGEKHRVRFIGVDTPETVHPSKPVEYYGKEATSYTRSKIASKTIYLEKDVSETDKYGRLLAYIWLTNDIDTDKVTKEDIATKQLNGMLVANGYAQSSSYPPDIKYQHFYRDLGADARNQSLGLWAEPEETEVASNVETEPKETVETVEAEPQPTPEPEPEPISNTVKYIGNRNTKKFHFTHCSSVDQMAEHNKVNLYSRDEAINGGYVPCKRCNP